MKFLSTVCMAAIVAGLFRLLVPENRFAKQISLLIVCVFLLASVNAVAGAELFLPTEGVTLTEQDYIGISGDVNRSLQKKICTDMKQKTEALLHENGLYPEQIHVNVNISGLYSISITQVKLVFAEGREDDAARAAQLLRDALPQDIGVAAEVKR